MAITEAEREAMYRVLYGAGVLYRGGNNGAAVRVEEGRLDAVSLRAMELDLCADRLEVSPSG